MHAEAQNALLELRGTFDTYVNVKRENAALEAELAALQAAAAVCATLLVRSASITTPPAHQHLCGGLANNHCMQHGHGLLS